MDEHIVQRLILRSMVFDSNSIASQFLDESFVSKIFLLL